MLNNNRNRIIAAAALIAIAVWLSLAFSAPRPLEVTFFDVGDGLCVFVYTPSGRCMIIDCGSSSWRDNSVVGKKVVMPYIQSLGLDSIDVAILSHPHADHASGFPALLKHKPARLVIECGADYDSPEHEAFESAVKKCRADRKIGYRGQVLELGDGIRAEILHPRQDAKYEDLNDNSIVIRLIYKQFSALLTADATQIAEDEILDAGVDVKAQVIQVGHHGSQSATSPRWLASVQPSIAVISCSKHSRYSFPSKTVTQRLSSFGIKTYSTAKCGSVTISTDGNKINVHTRKYSN